MSLLYVDSRGVDERVDLAECLATNKPRSNHPPVCYLTLPQGVNSFDLEVTGRPFEGDGFEVYRAQEWDAALLELADGTKTVRHPQQVAARHLKQLWGGFSEAERRPFWAQAQADAAGERWLFGGRLAQELRGTPRLSKRYRVDGHFVSAVAPHTETLTWFSPETDAMECSAELRAAKLCQPELELQMQQCIDLAPLAEAGQQWTFGAGPDLPPHAVPLVWISERGGAGVTSVLGRVADAAIGRHAKNIFVAERAPGLETPVRARLGGAQSAKAVATEVRRQVDMQWERLEAPGKKPYYEQKRAEEAARLDAVGDRGRWISLHDM